MGLFKRRDRHHDTTTTTTTIRNRTDNHHHHNHNTTTTGNASVFHTTASRFTMKRANSTEASPSASIPSVPLPRAPDPQVDPAAYLRSIYAVRERTRLVLEKAKRNQLRHFTVDMSKFPDTAAYVVSIIKVYFHTHTHTIGLLACS